MDCASNIIRYFIFFVNFLLALAGLGILVVGITTARSDGDSSSNIALGQVSAPAIMFSIVGACVFVFAFFGCWGALTENHCMICTYAVLLLILFLLQVAVAALAYSYSGQTKEYLTQDIAKRFEDYNSDNKTHSWVDALQQELECCGSVDVDTPWTKLGMTAPQSCYPHLDRTQPQFRRACISTLVEKVESSLSVITRVAAIVAIVEMVAITISCCLANSIKRAELRGYG